MKEFSDDAGSYSYNKVDEALQSVGVQMKKSNGDFKGFYDVIDELSQKWDTLSQKQKVYIATQAAGSRQQSRFVAMVDNYKRSQELLTAAYDANGAAEEQYEKTLDSLQAKLNQLKDAWDNFTMGIANSSFVKGAVDGLTALLKTIDKILSGANKIGTAIGGKGFGGITESITGMVTAIMGFKTAGAVVLSFLHTWKNLIEIGGGKTPMPSGGLADLFKSNMKTNMGKGVFNKETRSAFGTLIGRDLKKVFFKKPVEVPLTIDQKNILKAGEEASKTLKSSFASSFIEEGTKQALESQVAAAEKLKKGLAESGEAGAVGATGIKEFLGALSPAGKVILGVTAALAALYAAYRIHDAKLKSISDRGKAVTKEFTNANKTYKNNSKTIKDAKSVIDEYGEGVDSQGRNVSLSAANYEKYTKAVNNLTKAYPKLIKGVNSSGQAYINNATAIAEARKQAESNLDSAEKFYASKKAGNAVLNGSKASLQRNTSYSTFLGQARMTNGASSSTKRSTNPKLAEVQSGLESGIDLGVLTKYAGVSKDIYNQKKNIYELDKLDLNEVQANLKSSEAQGDTYKEGQREIKLLKKAQKGLQSGTKEVNKWLSNYTAQRGTFNSLSTPLQGMAQGSLRDLSVGIAGNKSSEKTALKALNKYKVQIQKDGPSIIKVQNDLKKAQDKFNESGKTDGALKTYQKSVSTARDELEELQKSYEKMEKSSDKATSEAGHALSEMVQKQLDSMDVAIDKAKGYAGDLASAINPWLDKLEAANDAYKEFQDATQTDFYTGAENISNILKDSLDTKNAAGYGSQTFWTGAETTLGSKTLKKYGYDLDKVKAKMVSVQKAAASGQSGFDSFSKLIVNAKKQIEGKGIGGKVYTDSNGLLTGFDVPSDKFEKLADTLGVSEKTLGAMINNARQFMKIDFSNVDMMKQNLESSKEALIAGSGKDKEYFVKSSTLRQAYKDANGGTDRGYNEQRKSWEKQGITAISTATSTKKLAQVLDKMGGMENLENNKKFDYEKAMTAFYKAGFSSKDELEKIASKLDPYLSKEGDTYKDIPSLIDALTNDNLANDAEEQTASNTSSIVSTLDQIALEQGIITDHLANQTSNKEASAQSTAQKWGGWTSDGKGNWTQPGGKEHVDYTKSDMYRASQSENIQQVNSIKSQYDSLENQYNKYHNAGKDKEANEVLSNMNLLDKVLQQYKGMKEYDYRALTAKGDQVNQLSSRGKEANRVGRDLISNLQDGGSDTRNWESDKQNFSDLTKASTSLKQLISQQLVSKDTQEELVKGFLDLNKVSLTRLSKNELKGVLSNLGATRKEQDKVWENFNKARRIENNFKGSKATKAEDLTKDNKYSTLFSGKAATKHINLIVNAKTASKKIDAVYDLVKSKTGVTKKIFLEAVAKKANGASEKQLTEYLSKNGVKGKKAKTIKQAVKLVVSGRIGNKKDVIAALEKKLSHIKGKKVTIDAKINPAGNKIKKVKGLLKDVNKQKTAPIIKANAKNAFSTISKVKEDLKDLDGDHADVYINTHKNTDSSGSGKGSGKSGKGGKGGNSWQGTATHSQVHTGSLASGSGSGKIGPDGRGGLTLTGEKGYEIAWIPSQNRSMILGNGGPEMTNLPADTVVYNHQQSRKIMKRGGLSIGSLASGNANLEDSIAAPQKNKEDKKDSIRKTSNIKGSVANGTVPFDIITQGATKRIKLGSAATGAGSAVKARGAIHGSGSGSVSRRGKSTVKSVSKSTSKSSNKLKKSKTKEKKAQSTITKWTLARGKVSARIFNIEKKIEILKRRENTVQNKFTKLLEKNWVTASQAQKYLNNIGKLYNQEIAQEKKLLKHYKKLLRKIGANPNPDTGKATKITGSAKVKGSNGKKKTYKLNKYAYVGDDGKLHYNEKALRKVDKKARKQLRSIIKKQFTKNQGIRQTISTRTKKTIANKKDKLKNYVYVGKDGKLHYNTKVLDKLTKSSQKRIKAVVKKNFKNGKLKNATISTTRAGGKVNKKDNIYNYVSIDKEGHLSINDKKIARLSKASRKAVRTTLKRQLAYNKRGKKITVEYEKRITKSKGKKGKKTTETKTVKAKGINTKDYINYDSKSGLAQINNKTLGRLAKKNKSLAKNLKAKLEDLIDKYNQGVEDAQEKIEDLKEQYEDYKKQYAEAYYLWENELTKIKNTQRGITELGNINNIFTANKDYTKALALNGNMEPGAAGTRESNINNNIANNLLEQVKAQRKLYTESYEQLLILNSKTPEASDVFTPLLKGIADGNEEAKTRKSDIIKAIQTGISITQDENGNLRSTIDRNAIMTRILSEGMQSDTASLVSDIISKCQDLIDTNEGAAADMYNAQTQLIQLQSDARSEQADIAGTLITGLQNGRKEEADDLSNINDAINNLQSKVLDKLQKQINLERQKRENEKTEKNIADLQNQLALLQQDTSGSNAASIKDLQKQLKEAQQDYADSLVDQQIQNMQDANEEASNQRETQINILNAQSDQLSQIDKDLIDNILQNPLLSKDDFIKFYRQANDYNNVTKTQQAQIDAEANKTYESAVANRNTLSGNFAKNITEGINNVTGHESGEDNTRAKNGADTAQGQASDYAKNPSSMPGYVNNNYSDPFANKHKYFNSISDIEKYLNDNKYSFNGHQKIDSEREAEMEDILKSGDSLTLYRRPGQKVTAISTGAQAFFSRYGNDIIGWNYKEGQALTDGKNGNLLSKTWRKNAVKRHPKYKEIFDKLGVTYKKGGLANFTGPAWLDGTTSHPEMVLNARDTANFIQLKDVLSDVRRNASAITPKNESTQNTFDININVDKIDSDYDVDQIAARVKRNIIQEAGYRNVNVIGNFK